MSRFLTMINSVPLALVVIFIFRELDLCTSTSSISTADLLSSSFGEDIFHQQAEKVTQTKVKATRSLQLVKELPPQCQTLFTETCNYKCISAAKDCSTKKCSSCSFCQNENQSNPSTSSCTLNTQFQDHTETILFSKTPKFFHRYTHSGKPYFHEGPPTFFRLDSDEFLDYFNTMHGHPLLNEKALHRRLELALNRVIEDEEINEDGDDDYFDVDTSNGQQHSDSSSLSKVEKLISKEFGLRSISSHIIIEDPIGDLQKVDLHGCIVADLDNDGYLDIYITNGGDGNMGIDKEEGEEDEEEIDDDDSNNDDKYNIVYNEDIDPKQLLDNMLFWGEPSKTSVDEQGIPLTVFRGGRQAAINANLGMRRGRGRFATMLDVNHDGFIDMFISQNRRMSDELVPGYLLINNGDRTFRNDTSIQEYTKAVLLTDANGDGIANEIVINRAFCFPQRDEPGDFKMDAKQFCATRPVGTTAIYTYNKDLETFEDIAKPFYHFDGLNYEEPMCCPHTSFDGANNCNAISIVSDDFDYDELADHLYLYKYQMEFYFSTDRNVKPDMTLDEPVVGNPHYIGLQIDFPSYCGEAINVNIIDLDNNGHDEILVTCGNAGVFLVYTRDESLMYSIKDGSTSTSISPSYKRSWSLENGCNQGSSENPLGQINDRYRASPTKRDMEKLCEKDYLHIWKIANRLCDRYKNADHEIPAAKATGVSIIDFNNDGFLDIVVSHSFGYLRFFYNEPTGITASNKFIAFSISDEVSYGIGTTFVLHCIDIESKKSVTQFHEASTHHHGSGKHSTLDDRVIFGLGQSLQPEKLVVRWPTDKFVDEQVEEIDLHDWEFSPQLVPIKIRMNKGKPSTREPDQPLPNPTQTSQPQPNPSPSPNQNPNPTKTNKTDHSPSNQPNQLPTQLHQASKTSNESVGSHATLHVNVLFVSFGFLLSSFLEL